MRAQARAVARIPAASCTAVAEGKAEEGKEELTRGAKLPERKERGRARRASGELVPASGPGVAAREREEVRGVTGLGRSGPGRGPRGSEERRERPEGGNGLGKERAREGEREGELGRAKEKVWAAFFYSFSFLFFFFTLTIQTKPFDFKQI
jgi:hypothetical protein